MENAQYQYENGLYDVEEFEAQRKIWARRFNTQPYWREAWIFFRDTLSPRLVAEIEVILNEIDSQGGT